VSEHSRTPDGGDRPRLERAKVAVAVAFAMNGVGYAGWFSRAPAVRADLDLGSAGFGVLLLFLAGAALVALPSSGPLVHRIGPARTVLLGSLSVAAGLLVLAGGTASGSVPVAAVGLVLSGLGTSTWDVAMNVHGADVERRLGRTLMPRFHASFSLGTVGGAGVGAAAAALGVPVATQVLATGVLLAAVMAVTVRSFLPMLVVAKEHRGSSGALRAWREPRTLLIG
jgi:fucose permease